MISEPQGVSPSLASFRSGVRKVLGIAYVRIFFGDLDFRRNGADELLRKRLRQASAPRRAMRKPLGIAYVGAKSLPKTSLRTIFGRNGA